MKCRSIVLNEEQIVALTVLTRSAWIKETEFQLEQAIKAGDTLSQLAIISGTVADEFNKMNLPLMLWMTMMHQHDAEELTIMVDDKLFSGFMFVINGDYSAMPENLSKHGEKWGKIANKVLEIQKELKVAFANSPEIDSGSAPVQHAPPTEFLN
jgi:hypothetical protein